MAKKTELLGTCPNCGEETLYLIVDTRPLKTENPDPAETKQEVVREYESCDNCDWACERT